MRLSIGEVGRAVGITVVFAVGVGVLALGANTLHGARAAPTPALTPTSPIIIQAPGSAATTGPGSSASVNNNTTENKTIIESRPPIPQSMVAYLLKPENKTVPPGACGALLEKGKFRVLLGASEAVYDNTPETILAMEGKPIIELESTGGKISIKTLLLYDRTHEIVARIMGDSAQMDARYFAQMIGDHHGFIFSDKVTNDPILTIEYLNPKTIKLTGVFQGEAPGKILTVTDDYMTMESSGSAGRFSGLCSVNTARLIGFQ